MKKLLSLILCAVLCASCFGTVSARENPDKKTYIVELDAPAVYSPDRVSMYSVGGDEEYRQALLEMQAEIKAQINGGVSMFSLRNAEQSYTYTDVFSGFTINVDEQTAEEIKNIEGVAAVYEDEIVTMSQPVKAENEDTYVSEQAVTGEMASLSAANSANMMNVQSAYDKGYNGEGRVIAIIDTAMNPEHSYYKLSDEATAKYTREDITRILQSNTMNVTASGSEVYKNAKVPFAFNYPYQSSDVSGSNLHGAHVAGIAAGNSVSVPDGIIRGVVPEAQILFFGMYHPDGTRTSQIVAALEDAVKFEVDAINISMGSDYTSENSGSALRSAAQACRNAGITVAKAAGNADRSSYHTDISDYGTADNRTHPYATVVGSVQSEMVYMNYLEDDEGNKYPCVAKGRTSLLDSLEVIEVADCGSGTVEEINSANVRGKMALISMPDSCVSKSVSTYGTRARNAGAVAVVVGYNSNDLPDGNSGYAYPLYLVSRDTAEEIRNNAATLCYTTLSAVMQRADAPYQNEYSSYGYADNLDISVDYSAPGGNVYSSYSGTSGFATLSGTSMAAPQITGATSLMYQYVEDAFPAYTGANKLQLVKNLLASTAETVYDQSGAVASPRKVGSGLIHLDKAMETKVILKGRNPTETKINIGADLTKTFKLNFTIQNISNTTVTFNKINVELSADDYKNYDGFGYGYCGRKKLTATVSGSSGVNVAAGRSVPMTLTVTLNDSDIAYLEEAMPNGFFIDGKVTLSSAAHCDVGIPFSGFYGDWSKLPVMDEQRFLNYVDIYGVTDGGFKAQAMLSKSGTEIVMPVSDNVDEAVANVRAILNFNPKRNAYATVKVDGVTIVNNAFINKEQDMAYYFGKKLLGDLSSVSEINISLRLPYYNTLSRNIDYTIKIVKDNTPPVIEDMYVENGETVNLEVSDNFGVNSVTAYGQTDDGTTIDDAYIDAESGTAQFDIAGREKIEYEVYDCAFNKTVFSPHIGIEVKDGRAIFTNNTHKNIGGDCMLAVYENGKMTEFSKLSGENFVLDAYDTANYNITSYSVKKYKLFFWSNTGSVIPLCAAYNNME